MDSPFRKAKGAGFVLDGDLPKLVYRQFLKQKGEVHPGHRHTVDHPTILVTGSVHVKWNNDRGHGERTFVSPDHFLVRADTEHEITALEDNTIWLCCFLPPDGYEEDLRAFWN